MSDTQNQPEAIAEVFTPEQVRIALDNWLQYGEESFNRTHLGYFSGEGWAARCLRFHLAQLMQQPASEPAQPVPLEQLAAELLADVAEGWQHAPAIEIHDIILRALQQATAQKDAEIARLKDERDAAAQYRTGHHPSCNGMDSAEMRCGCGYLDGTAYRDLVDERDALKTECERLRSVMSEAGEYARSAAQALMVSEGIRVSGLTECVEKLKAALQ